MLYALMIDPFISTAYTLDGPDLVRRFGALDYYWTRVGFQLPARGLYSAFGPVAGFFLFRYLLALVAIVPLFLLFRRVAGTGAGWVAVLALLTSSVVVTGWSTDYPTAAALSYLIAGTSCLFMPAASGRARVSWALAAGVLFGLALGCGLITGFVVAGALLGRLLTMRRASRVQSLAGVALACAGGLAAFAALALAAKAYLGHGDLLLPQLQALRRFQDPANLGFYHSSTWRWLIDDIYVLAPPAILGSWLVAAWPVARRSLPPAEIGFACATAITYAVFVVDQFLVRSWALEYWLYADLLWSLVIPLLVFTILRIAGITHNRGSMRLLFVGLSVLAAPLLLRVFRDQLHLSFAAALVTLAAPAIAVLAARLRPALIVRLGAVAVVNVASTLLVVGAPSFVVFPGQIAYVTPDYGTTFFGSVQPALDEYTVVTRFYQMIPTAEQVPGELAVWLPQNPSHLVITSTGVTTYLKYALPDALSNLTVTDVSYLHSHDVHILLVLSDTGNEFNAARTSLSAAAIGVRTLVDTEISAGSAHLYVEILQLSG